MISLDQIKALREQTGVSIMQCRKALEGAAGDAEKALFFLRKQSGVIAQKKADRDLGAGLVQGYVHTTGTMGALLELNCETDFVAKNPEFKQLAYDLAMHVAALAPEYLEYKDIPEAKKEEVRALFVAEVGSSASDKPAEIQQKMLDGKITGYFREKTLMDQSFVKDSNCTVADLIKIYIQKFGEKIAVGRFSRIAVLGA